MNVIINVDIYDFHKYRTNVFIIFDKVILKIKPMNEFKEETIEFENIFDLKGSLLLPAFINGHTHIYSTFARGLNLPFSPNNFQDILDQLWWKVDRHIDQETLYYSGLMYGIEAIHNGVTTIIDHNASGQHITNSSLTLEKSICETLKLKGIFCYETSDRFPIEECIEENIKFYNKHGENSSALFGMHASMSLSDTSLMKIKKAIGDIPIHIHCAESNDDVNDSINRSGLRVIERLDKYNLLNKNSLIAHCVHINNEEAKLLREKNIRVAFNANSNMNNSVGLPNYNLFKNNNIKTIIGTDGLGCNISHEYITLVHAFKNNLGNPNSFGLGDLVSMIKDGYAYASSLLKIKLGRIEEGFSADFQSYKYVPFTEMNEENILGHIFYGIFFNLKPSNLWSSGYQVLKENQITMNVQNEYKIATQISKRLWNRILVE